MIKRFLRKYWITLIIIAAAFGLYDYASSNSLINTFVFPSPADIGASFKRYFYPTMLKNLVATFQLLIPSLIIAILLALVLGVILGLNSRIREALHPIIYAISVIPALLLAPIALNLAPSFRSASLFLIVYNTIFPTLFATITGIMTIDKRYLDNAATLELKGWRKMTKVVLPAAMPSIVSGFITSLRSSFLVLVFAEMYGTQYGMGFFIKKYSNMGLYKEVWSGFLFLVVVLIIVMKLFEKLQTRLLDWTIDD